MQQRAADGDRSGLHNYSQAQQGTAASLSLKARETASLSLKRIFEQQIMINGPSSAPSHHRQVSLQGIDGDQHTGHHLVQDQIHASAPDVEIDLELRLAAPCSSSSSASHTEDEAAPRRAQEPTVSSVNAVAGKAQLTILYAGMVCVYEDIPADKANAIMLLAAASGDQSGSKDVNAADHKRRRREKPTSPSDILSIPAKPVGRSQAELPFARKVSLARFLEKRKERLEAKAATIQAHIYGDAKLTAMSEVDSQPPYKKPYTTSPNFDTYKTTQ